jgi:hypothetical protein
LNSFLLLLCVVVLIAALGLVQGEMTAAYFVRALDWSGFACILLGCVSVLGAFASRGSFEVQFSRSASTEDIDRRSARDIREMLGSFYHLILFAWTGGLQLFLSMLIHRFAS